MTPGSPAHARTCPGCEPRDASRDSSAGTRNYTFDSCGLNEQKIWANAHEARDSISLISYAGCLGLSPVISAIIQPEIAKNLVKPDNFGGSWSFKVIDVGIPSERSSAMLVMTSSRSMSICNRSHVDYYSRNRAFWRRYLNLMPSYGGLLELYRIEICTVKIYV